MFANLPGYIWFDGKILPWQSAQAPLMTHTLHYVSSVYEGLRAYQGRLLQGHAHYQRLHQSAASLGFKIPHKTETLLDATEQLLKKGDYYQTYVREIAWCGSNKMTAPHLHADVHTAIGIWERPIKYPAHYYSSGIHMNIAEWRRPDPQTAPVHNKASGLYMISSMSKATSEKLGFDDALMLDYQGYIAEATRSNIFLVIDGKLYTPRPDCFLDGITRRICIDIAKRLGIATTETKLTLTDLARTQAVLLTGTAIEILPVGLIQGKDKTWQFVPDSVTHAIRSAFKTMTNHL